jgi:hypothetical protein
MLCDSHVDGPLRPIELRSGFEEIKKRCDGRGTGNAAASLIVLTPQPGSNAGAADGPGFPVPIDHDVCEAAPLAVWNALWWQNSVIGTLRQRNLTLTLPAYIASVGYYSPTCCVDPGRPQVARGFCVGLFDAERSAGSRHLCRVTAMLTPRVPPQVVQTKPLRF